MSDSVPFFSGSTIQRALEAFLNEQPPIEDGTSLAHTAHADCREVFRKMLVDPAGFDKCVITIRRFGSTFLDTLGYVPDHMSSTDPVLEKARRLSGFVIAFVVEYVSRNPGDVDGWLEGVIEHAHIPEYGERGMISWALHQLPHKMQAEFFANPAVQGVLDGAAMGVKFSEMVDGWKSELIDQEARVLSLKGQLNRAEHQANFSLLIRAFRALRRQRRSEQCRLQWAIVAFAFVLLCPIGAALMNVYVELGARQDITVACIKVAADSSLQKACSGVGLFDFLARVGVYIPGLLALELVLIYFFRILLQRLKSADVLVMQLDLRIATCQFIQSYAHFAGNVPEGRQKMLEKFESLIFSGLQASEERLPSTFDGMDQLGQLLQGLRSGAATR